jgi:hypothetical protein
MKKIIFFSAFLINSVAIGQTRLKISFEKDKIEVDRDSTGYINIDMPVKINSTEFPPGTVLIIKNISKESSLPETAYTWGEPQEIKLSDYGADTWAPFIKLSPDPTKKEMKQELHVKLILKTDFDRKIEFETAQKLVIIINPVKVLTETGKPPKIKNKNSWQCENDESNTQKTEIIQYTDFLGFGNDRPNGLLQQQFLFKWPINKKQISVSKNIKIQFLRSVLLPNILFNRIEKAKDDSSLLHPIGYTIRQIDNTTRDTALSPVASTFDIIRYNTFKIESKIVLLAIQIHNTRIYFDYQLGLLRNKIKDTTGSKTERFIYSFQSGWSVYIKSLLDQKTKLNIEVEAGLNHVTLKDNFFKQYDVYATDNDGKKSIAFPASEKFNKTSRPIYYGIITLRKDWGQDSKNSVFFRFKYQNQNGLYKFYAKERPGNIKEESFSNHFLQINLGISLGLEKLFSN